jgi:hypothetical protein
MQPHQKPAESSLPCRTYDSDRPRVDWPRKRPHFLSHYSRINTYGLTFFLSIHILLQFSTTICLLLMRPPQDNRGAEVTDMVGLGETHWDELDKVISDRNVDVATF